MDKFKTGIIFLTMLFLVFSCSSTKQVLKNPSSKFAGTTLSKKIDETGSIAVPKEPATSFNTEDSEVIAYAKFDNLYGKHKIKWDWYKPDGDLYCSSGTSSLKISKNNFVKEAGSWHKISINGDQASDFPGQWHVNVIFDDELLESKQFYIKPFSDLTKLPDDMLQKPFPKDWGLIIGIENYAQLPTVEYAKKDALIMKEYFIKILGVPEENIVYLIDSDATKSRIEGFIKQYIPSNVGRDTTLYVYFAGHGAPDMTKGDPYLIPYDGDTRFLEQSGYKLKQFYSDLDDLDIHRSYVFIDSCFSGVASRAADMLTKGSRPALLHVADVELSSSSVVSIGAASAGQISYAYREAKHGLFTYYLLRALKGEADTDDDSWVSVKEIFQYVETNVTRASRKMGKEQTPVITPPLKTVKDISISRVQR